MPTRPRLFSLLAFALAFSAPAAAAPPPTEGDVYAELAGYEARVAAVGFRLATANAGWCPVRQAQFGWIWGDPLLYAAKDRDAARAAYGAAAADLPFLAAIAPGSPAAAAGLRVGEPVAELGGADRSARDGDDDFARIAAFEKAAAALPPGTPAELAIGGHPRTVTPVAGCVSDFRVEARDRATGAADGRLVLVSAGLVAFAADEDELAAAVAHELAHNILRHRARLDDAKVDRGLFQNFGRSARLFRQTEIEADRLSVWLMRGAGYDPRAAIRFWERFGTRGGPVLIQPGTHPRWHDRVKSFEEEIAAIDAAEAAGRPLEPPLIAAPPPLE